MNKLPITTKLAMMAGLGLGTTSSLLDSFLPKKRKPKEVNLDKMEAARLKREKRAARNRRLTGNGDTDNQV